MKTYRSHKAVSIISIIAFAVVAQIGVQAQTQLDAVLSIKAKPEASLEKVSFVREQILRDAALPLGARAGLSDRSRELMAVLDSRAKALDSRFNFNALVMGASVLPPIISVSKDVVALDSSTMRVAGAVYHIDAPARFAMPTPTWRDWLYLGLDESAIQAPTLGAGAPSGASEEALWKKLVSESYEQGRQQAQAVFDANLASLERAHAGMRLYYELWQRGMVSAPIIATDNQIMQREDANTVSVGNTMYKITAQTDFNQPFQWVPLE